MRLGLSLSLTQPRSAISVGFNSSPAAAYDAGDEEITVTGSTNFDLSAGRFGAKFTVNGVDVGYRHGVGAVAGAQSMIVSLTDPAPAGLGAEVGDLIGIDPGYNLADSWDDPVYASDSGLYVTASIVTPTITGFSNPPQVGETGTGVNGTALAKIGATRSVLWLAAGVTTGDTDNSYTAVTGDLTKALTFRNTVDGVSATSAATAAVISGFVFGTLVNEQPLSTAANFGDFTAASVTLAETPAAGNLLVAITGVRTPSTSAAMTLAGFTEVGSHRSPTANIGGQYGRLQIFTKVAAGTEGVLTSGGETGRENFLIVGEFAVSSGTPTWSAENGGTVITSDGDSLPALTLWGPDSANIVLTSTSGLVVACSITQGAVDTVDADWSANDVLNLGTGSSRMWAGFRIYTTSGAKDISQLLRKTTSGINEASLGYGVKATI